MSKQKTKARSGCLKKASDRTRARSYRDRHAETQSRIRQPGFRHANPGPSALDDPLGSQNAKVLLAMQNR